MAALVMALRLVLMGVVDAGVLAATAGAVCVAAGGLAAAFWRRGRIQAGRAASGVAGGGSSAWQSQGREPVGRVSAGSAGGASRSRMGQGSVRLNQALLVLAVGASCAVAALAASASLARVDALAGELGGTSMSSLEFVVESDGSAISSGWMCRASTQAGGASGSVWLTSSERLGFGETVRVVGRFSENGGDEWGTSSRARGLSGRVRAVRVVSSESPVGVLGALCALRAWALAAINPELSAGRALMAGVLVSDRTQLDAQGVEDEFSAAGLTHLVAVSGSHLVVVGASLEGLLLALGAGPRIRTGFVALVTGAYVVLCACPSSAVRSWVMLCAAMGGRLLGRRSHAPSGMALTGVAMCLMDPACSCDLGFILSCLSVGALSLFSGYMAWLLELAAPRLGPVLAPLRVSAPCRALRKRFPRLERNAAHAAQSLRETLAATLVCQLATMPACAVTFGTVSLVAPLANVVVGPLFGPIVSAGMAALALSWVPGAGQLPVGLVTLLCELSVALARMFGSMPFARIAVSLGEAWELCPLVCGAVLYLWWPQPNKRQLGTCVGVGFALGLALFLRLYVLVPASVTVLDVGQGDAILVREGPHALLVDTGPEGEIAEALARNHVLWLDAVVLTHLHDDHVGGIDDLAGLVSVGTVYVGEGVASALPDELAQNMAELCGAGGGGSAQELFDSAGEDTAQEVSGGAAGDGVQRGSSTDSGSTVQEPSGTGGMACVQELHEGDVLRLGGFSLECLWPREASDGSENEDSVCLRLTYGGGASASDSSLVLPVSGGFDVFTSALTSFLVGESETSAPTLTALLTGDAESDVLAQIADETGDIDLLKVGHHGSKASITEQEAGVLAPELAVASAGEGNSYGHPTQECIDAIESSGCAFLCTKDVGDVTVEPAPSGISVRCQRGL